MEKVEKKKNIALVVIVIETILLAVACVYIIVSNRGLLSKNEQSVNVSDSNQPINTDEENITISTDKKQWTNYLLDSHILESKAYTIDASVDITLDNLKDILSSFENKTLIKSYYQARGGVIDGKNLEILYEYNELKYKMIIETYDVESYCDIFPIENLDEELINILDSASVTEKNSELKGKEDTRYYYEINDCDSNVLEKYFN